MGYKWDLGATPAGGQWVDTDSCLADVRDDWLSGLVVDLLRSSFLYMTGYSTLLRLIMPHLYKKSDEMPFPSL
jgi:hypothetical protein